MRRSLLLAVVVLALAPAGGRAVTLAQVGDFSAPV